MSSDNGWIVIILMHIFQIFGNCSCIYIVWLKSNRGLVCYDLWSFEELDTTLGLDNNFFGCFAYINVWLKMRYLSPTPQKCSHPVVNHDNLPYSLINKYISFANYILSHKMCKWQYIYCLKCLFCIIHGMPLSTCCPPTWLPIFQTKSCEKRNGIVKVFNCPPGSNSPRGFQRNWKLMWSSQVLLMINICRRGVQYSLW